MSTPKTIDLTIQDVVYRGRGLARHEQLVYFVNGVLPGERVRARITKRKKNCVEAELVEVLTPSPARIAPVCPLASDCPGCTYQHIDYAEELRLKQRQLVNLLERIGKCSDVTCREPVAAPFPLAYRNRITLHASRERLGYYGHDNRSIVDVPRCALAVEPINEALAVLRDDSSHRGRLADGASLALRWTAADGCLHWSGKPDRDILTETTELGALAVPTRSFFQVNPAVATHLLVAVSDAIRDAAPNVVVDLFCGVGTFALAAARAGVRDVLGIDSDRRAVRAARQNADALSYDRVVFKTGRVEEQLDDAFEPVDSAETMVIVDPPRSGLEGPVIEGIARHRPVDIAYVSCAADTMARDVRRFMDHGYRLVDTTLVDMFPRTPYFETLTRLTR